MVNYLMIFQVLHSSGGDFLESYFISETKMFVAGTGNANSGQMYFSSMDGGMNFAQIAKDSIGVFDNSGRYGFKKASFVDENNGWMLWDRGCNSKCYEVIRTTDGGEKWEQIVWDSKPDM